MTTDEIVIDTVVSKYCDHQPLSRQSAMLERKRSTNFDQHRPTYLYAWRSNKN
jgi:hypothetical protein